MNEILETFSAHANFAYAILFLYSLGGGMIALLAAGLLASAGSLDIALCMLTAAVANFLGDEGLYYFAKLNKAQVLANFKKHRRKLALAQILFKSYGIYIIIAKKYIYGLKTLIPLAIGLSKFDAKKFTLINALGAILWAISLGLLAFFAGDLVRYLSNYFGSNSATLIIGLVLILALIWVYFSKTTKKR